VRDLLTAGNKPLALNIRGFEDKRPGMLMFKPGDRLLGFMDRVKSTGKFDVGVHGSPGSVGFQIKNGAAHLPENWHSFDHRQLASPMKANGWNGEPVRLLSCNTGSLPGGFAQKANHLGVSVEAPNDFLWVYPNGKLAVAPFDAAGTRMHPTQRAASTYSNRERRLLHDLRCPPAPGLRARDPGRRETGHAAAR
jgi:hypothetical protein